MVACPTPACVKKKADVSSTPKAADDSSLAGREKRRSERQRKRRNDREWNVFVEELIGREARERWEGLKEKRRIDSG